MGQHAGLELFLQSADTGEDAYNELTANVNQKVSGMSGSEKNKLGLFLKYIFKGIDSQKNVNLN
jgi:hypothetical protein